MTVKDIALSGNSGATFLAIAFAPVRNAKFTGRVSEFFLERCYQYSLRVFECLKRLHRSVSEALSFVAFSLALEISIARSHPL